MIHCISPLTFKFHHLLTIDTGQQLPGYGNLTYATWRIMAAAWAPTSNKPQPRMGAIVIFPEVLGAQ